jgi:flagellar protein FlaF
MGFSVSGSAAIIFAAMFIAFGMWHTTATNGFERVSEAQNDRADAALDRQNTDVAIDSVVLNATSNEMQVNATNHGASTLSIEETDVLVDNDYYAEWRTDATVDGSPGTDLWLPGETLVFNITVGSADQVKLVTETGVADTAEVTSA